MQDMKKEREEEGQGYFGPVVGQASLLSLQAASDSRSKWKATADGRISKKGGGKTRGGKKNKTNSSSKRASSTAGGPITTQQHDGYILPNLIQSN